MGRIWKMLASSKEIGTTGGYQPWSRNLHRKSWDSRNSGYKQPIPCDSGQIQGATNTSCGFGPTDSFLRIKTYSEVEGTKEDSGTPNNEDFDADLNDNPFYTDLNRGIK